MDSFEWLGDMLSSGNSGYPPAPLPEDTERSVPPAPTPARGDDRDT